MLLLIVTGSLKELASNYARSVVHDRVARQPTVTGSAATSRTEAFTDDARDRLATTSYGPSSLVAFTYHANGNRTSVTSGGVVTAYAVDAADQLTELSSGGAVIQSFGHDANGNRTSSSPAGGTASTYGFEWRNRMTSANVSGTTVTYTYAGDDRRVTRTVAGSTTNYLWDRQAGLPELVDDGTTIYLQAGGDVQREEKLGRIAP